MSDSMWVVSLCIFNATQKALLAHQYRYFPWFAGWEHRGWSKLKLPRSLVCSTALERVYLLRSSDLAQGDIPQ